jgi:aminoglycoside 6'-N-acetyltransferase I
MRIETCHDRHLNQWADLPAKLWPLYSREHHHMELADLLAKSDINRVAFIALAKINAPLGFVEAALRHDYVNGCESSPVVFLEGIYVLPTARRKGVAGAPRKRPEAALDFLVVGVSAGTQYQIERN